MNHTDAFTQGQTPTAPAKAADRSHSQEQSNGQLTADQEMAFRLKQTIDRTGKYSYKLDDLAAGYAAGTGVPSAEARAEIQAKFEQHIGKSPQQYLDHRFETRKANSQSRGR